MCLLHDIARWIGCIAMLPQFAACLDQHLKCFCYRGRVMPDTLRLSALVQRQCMSLVGQYDMDLFTSIFSLLFMPVPGFHLDGLPPVEVGASPPIIAVNCSPACVLLSIAKPVTICLS